MADVDTVGILLNALGNPSYMVAGRATALPDDDRVGILLKNITPSMMARRARESAGRRRVNPATVGPGRPMDPPGTARALRHLHRHLPIQRVRPAGAGWPDTLAGRLRCEHRSAAVGSCWSGRAARGFNEEIDIPDDGAGRAGAPPLGWPWDRPPPATLPPVESPPPHACAGPPYVGTIIDLFA